MSDTCSVGESEARYPLISFCTTRLKSGVEEVVLGISGGAELLVGTAFAAGEVPTCGRTCTAGTTAIGGIDAVGGVVALAAAEAASDKPNTGGVAGRTEMKVWISARASTVIVSDSCRRVGELLLPSIVRR